MWCGKKLTGKGEKETAVGNDRFDQHLQLMSCPFDTAILSRPVWKIVGELHAEPLRALITKADDSCGFLFTKVHPGSGARTAELSGLKYVLSQVSLTCSPAQSTPSNSSFRLQRGSDSSMTRHETLAHARNFTQDRWSLDDEISRCEHDTFFERWLTNSLTSDHIHLLQVQDGICTFRLQAKIMTIDLLSVLTPGRGTGSALLRALMDIARRNSIDQITVTTEANNSSAIGLYLRLGFRPVETRWVFHYHGRSPVRSKPHET